MRLSFSHLWLASFAAAGFAQTLVRDIRVGSSGSNPAAFADYVGTGFFVADDGTTGAELWRTDGFSGGTQRVADIRAGALGSEPRELVRVGEYLFFTADDGVHGREIWLTDLVGGGTRMLTELVPGVGSGAPTNLRSVNGRLFFTATTVATGNELFQAGGSPLAITLVRDINPGAASSNPTNLIVTGSALYFAANDGTNGVEPWIAISAGNAAQLRDVRPGAGSGGMRPIAVFGEIVYFAADDGVVGEELWRTDGTQAGTVLVADINPGAPGSSPQTGAAVTAGVVFTATEPTTGRELWYTGGTSATTRRVADIAAGARDAVFQHMVTANQRVFFGVNDGVRGLEPWVTDGTPTGTYSLGDLNPGAASSLSTRAGSFAAAGLSSRVVFAADDGVNGSEPWVTDGNPEGTTRLRQLVSGAAGSDPAGFVTLGTRVLFAATTPTTGTELYAVPLRVFGGANAQRVGFACPNRLGGFPDLFAAGLPVIGNARFAIELSNALPNAFGTVLVGARAATPLGSSCTLFVGGDLIVTSIVADASGSAVIPLRIPLVEDLIGTAPSVQALLVDPQSVLPFPVTLTHGLELVIGR